MRVLFRVDASAVIGSGHLMRCITLARQLFEQGARLTFACRELEDAPLALVPPEYELLRLPERYADESPTSVAEARIDNRADGEALQALLGERCFDWCVVDHYGLNAEWHTRARSHSRRVMVLDDLANRPLDCDLLLDQGLPSDLDKRYAPYLPAQAVCLFGPEYALLREEFLIARSLAAPRSDLRRVVVFFTGGNDHGETLKAARALAAWRPTLEVDLVIGAGHPDAEVLEVLCDERGWGLHCQIDYMAQLMTAADLALGAPGSASWERCALGLPSLLAVLAENQREQAAGLVERGVAIHLGDAADLRDSDYRQALESLSREHLHELSQSAWQQVDGLGAARVSRTMLEMSVGL